MIDFVQWNWGSVFSNRHCSMPRESAHINVLEMVKVMLLAQCTSHRRSSFTAALPHCLYLHSSIINTPSCIAAFWSSASSCFTPSTKPGLLAGSYNWWGMGWDASLLSDATEFVIVPIENILSW